ncbi:AAA family ATPase [Streptomyces sp. NPDC058847]|uniref:AAA family ATPase n=1 Tax=Streptomyces sp. NPDC058847 TaxID=3346649 RepID=UPI003678D872
MGASLYLACLYAENFRIFGATPQKNGDEDASLSLDFGPATNVLVGENDSGKTAIIDAIRLSLLTTAADFYRITRDDIHVGPDGRADTFKITCGFKNLSTEEQAVFLELLTVDGNGNVALYVTVKAELMDPLRPHRVAVTTRTGRDGQGPALDGAARELLKATYLRPCGMPRQSCARAVDHGCHRSSQGTRPCAHKVRTTSTRRRAARAPWWATYAAQSARSATTTR